MSTDFQEEHGQFLKSDMEETSSGWTGIGSVIKRESETLESNSDFQDVQDNDTADRVISAVVRSVCSSPSDSTSADGVVSMVQRNGILEQRFSSSSLKCSICDYLPPNQEDLEVHLTVEHLNWIPFECYYCKYVFLPTERAVTMHFSQLHKGKVVKASSRVDPNKSADLREMLDRSLELSGYLTAGCSRSPYNNRPNKRKHSDENTPQGSCSGSPLADGRIATPIEWPVSPRSKNWVESTEGEPGSSTSTHKKVSQKVMCNLCSAVVTKTDTSKLYHLWRHHMPAPPYVCNYCPFRTFQHFGATQMQKHVQQKHPEELCTFTENKEVYVSELKAASLACFDSLANGIVIRWHRSRQPAAEPSAQAQQQPLPLAALLGFAEPNDEQTASSDKEPASVGPTTGAADDYWSAAGAGVELN